MSHNFRSNFRSWFASRTITFTDITSRLTPNLWKENILTLFTVYLLLLTRKNYPIHIAGSQRNTSWQQQEIRQYRTVLSKDPKNGWEEAGDVHSSLEIILWDTGVFWRKNSMIFTSKPWIPTGISCMITILNSKLSLTLWCWKGKQLPSFCITSTEVHIAATNYSGFTSADTGIHKMQFLVFLWFR